MKKSAKEIGKSAAILTAKQPVDLDKVDESGISPNERKFFDLVEANNLDGVRSMITANKKLNVGAVDNYREWIRCFYKGGF